MERTSIDADPLNSVDRSVSETFVQDNTKMMDELDAKGCTPLHWAIWRCFHQKKEKAEEAKQTIRLLLRSGADPNAAIAAAAPPPVDAMDEEGAPRNIKIYFLIFLLIYYFFSQARKRLRAPQATSPSVRRRWRAVWDPSECG
jgi:hypothetical protein